MGSKSEWIATQAIKVLVIAFIIQIARGVNADWGTSLGMGITASLLAGLLAWIIIRYIKKS